MKPRTIVIIILTVFSVPVVLVGGCTATLGWVIYKSYAPVASSANQFLENVRTGRIKEAFDSTAESVRNKATMSQFAAEVKALGLTDAQKASWNSFEIQNHSASLEGYITMASGERSSITMTLIHRQAVWKVESLRLGENKTRNNQSNNKNKAS